MVDAPLQIEAGTIIKFEAEMYMGVGEGSVAALGTETAPIIFTSVLNDAHGGEAGKYREVMQKAPSERILMPTPRLRYLAHICLVLSHLGGSIKRGRPTLLPRV
jgi:hypothetical protein